jgi:flagellar protein FlaG
MTNISISSASAEGLVPERPARPATAAAPSPISASANPAPAKIAAERPAVVSKAAPSPQELQQMVDQMQTKTATLSPELQFSLDKESGKTIVKVTDSNTKDVIWQFPSEEALQVTKELDRYQRGLLVNRKA